MPIVSTPSADTSDSIRDIDRCYRRKLSLISVLSVQSETASIYPSSIIATVSIVIAVGVVPIASITIAEVSIPINCRPELLVLKAKAVDDTDIGNGSYIVSIAVADGNGSSCKKLNKK